MNLSVHYSFFSLLAPPSTGVCAFWRHKSLALRKTTSKNRYPRNTRNTICQIQPPIQFPGSATVNKADTKSMRCGLFAAHSRYLFQLGVKLLVAVLPNSLLVSLWFITSFPDKSTSPNVTDDERISLPKLKSK